MHSYPQLSAPEPSGRAPKEVAEIFRRFGDMYRRDHALSPDQSRAMNDIAACRTAVLGGHMEACQRCDYQKPAYNSCNNRHCPKCQALAQAKWVEARMERVLPTHYFHVVFTLPAELRALALQNRERVYDLLFECATATLIALCADAKRLGAQPGITAVLHTWARDLSYHPHLHCIVTGGGLTKDGSRWLNVKGKDDFLLPVTVVSRLFRGKFMDGLWKAFCKGLLTLTGSCAGLQDEREFKRLKRTLYRHEWVVYAKQPFGGPKQVFSYLGRYTHRVGLSNHRLQRINEGGIRFSTRDGKRVTLRPMEFIRRFLLHILPGGYKKIRHYGLCAPVNVNTRLKKAHALLTVAGGGRPVEEELTQPDLEGAAGEEAGWRALHLRLTGRDVRKCPRCGEGVIELLPLTRDPPPS